MSESYDFSTCCPCEECEGSDKVIDWTHANCGGYYKIDEEGRIYCNECYKPSHLWEMRFSCPNKNYKEENTYDRYYSYIKMIIKTPSWPNSFKVNLINSLMKQYNSMK